jgi:hypothetical protein
LTSKLSPKLTPEAGPKVGLLGLLLEAMGYRARLDEDRVEVTLINNKTNLTSKLSRKLTPPDGQKVGLLGLLWLLVEAMGDCARLDEERLEDRLMNKNTILTSKLSPKLTPRDGQKVGLLGLLGVVGLLGLLGLLEATGTLPGWTRAVPRSC